MRRRGSGSHHERQKSSYCPRSAACMHQVLEIKWRLIQLGGCPVVSPLLPYLRNYNLYDKYDQWHQQVMSPRSAGAFLVSLFKNTDDSYETNPLTIFFQSTCERVSCAFNPGLSASIFSPSNPAQSGKMATVQTGRQRSHSTWRCACARAS